MPADVGRVPPPSESAPPSAAAGVTDTGLICLLILARFYDLPADGSQLRHQFAQSGQVLSDTDLLRAAKHLGLKAGCSDRRLEQARRDSASSSGEANGWPLCRAREDRRGEGPRPRSHRSASARALSRTVRIGLDGTITVLHQASQSASARSEVRFHLVHPRDRQVPKASR